MVHFYLPLSITGLNNYSLSYHLRLSLTFGCLWPAAHLRLSLYLLIIRYVLKITLKVSDPELLAVSLQGYKISIWLELKNLTLFSFLMEGWRNVYLILLLISSENCKSWRMWLIVLQCLLLYSRFQNSIMTSLSNVVKATNSCLPHKNLKPKHLALVLFCG